MELVEEMSQATTTVANGTGKAVRTGFNAAIQAVQSMFYGSNDPLTLGYSVAGMIWLDSGNHLVKQMNSGNTAWVTIGNINSSTGIITWTNHVALPLAGGTMTGAIKTPNPVSLTSSSGVVTLTSGSNSFVVSGTEAVTKITGWIAGIVVIRWATARTLTYNSTSLILQNSQNRTTAAGDIGIYEMTSSGAREINYFLSSTSTEMSAFPLGQGDYIASGMKMSSISSLVATLASGTIVIDNTPVAVGSGSVTLPTQSANLIYANASGDLGYVTTAYPTSFLDNYTVGFWKFNQTTSGAVIPNSAYGVSSSAVANDLTPTGGVSTVAGWCGDYALKLDGTSGYFVGANTTNFPSGAAEREINFMFTVNKISTSADNTLFSYGANSSSALFNCLISTSGYLVIYGYSNDITTTFKVEVGKTYLVTIQYDGSYVYIYVNGNLVYKASWTISTTLTYSMYVGQRIGYTTYNSYITCHFLELRTKTRSAAKLGAMANSLMLPCFYTKSGATAPTVPSAYSSEYHEYLFSESSGTSIADSNTTSALTGTATNTTAGVTSDIGLTYARKFTAGYVSLGSFAVASTFTYVGVIKIDSYSSFRVLFSNRTSSTTGILLGINTSGYLSYTYVQGASDVTVGTSQIPLGTPVFIAVTINGTTMTIYQNSGQKALTTTITTPNTTSGAAYLGYEPTTYTTGFTGKMEYAMFVNSELSQAEINYYYTELMETGRRSIIDDMLPSSSVALAFARTNGSKIIEYNDTDYKYGRRATISLGAGCEWDERTALCWKIL
ncbi:MAG: Concanavalin A-like lectin/glucanase superfamily [Firmicutes bacterium]|nr:Concanavalin A-like lectin/glucanase superfamily [Bacillota bacterium]